MQRFGAQFQCISFDTCGAGRSDKPVPKGSYGVDRHAAVLDAVKVGKVLLVGHSMGGNIACRFYRSNPEGVVGIIFVGSYVSGKQIDSIGNTLDRIKAAVKMKLNRIDFYRQVGLPEEIAMEATKWPLYGINGNAQSFMEFDASAERGDITVPCLVVHGYEQPYCSVSRRKNYLVTGLLLECLVDSTSPAYLADLGS